jgi:hypothetical protein
VICPFSANYLLLLFRRLQQGAVQPPPIPPSCRAEVFRKDQPAGFYVSIRPDPIQAIRVLFIEQLESKVKEL